MGANSEPKLLKRAVQIALTALWTKLRMWDGGVNMYLRYLEYNLPAEVN